MIDLAALVWTALRKGVYPITGLNSSIFYFVNVDEVPGYETRPDIPYNEFIVSKLYGSVKAQVNAKNITNTGFKQFINVLVSWCNHLISTYPYREYNFNYGLESNRDAQYRLNTHINEINADLGLLWDQYNRDNSQGILNDAYFQDTYWTSEKSTDLLWNAALMINILYHFLAPDMGWVFFNEKTALTNNNALKFTFSNDVNVLNVNNDLHNPLVVYNKYGRLRALLTNTDYACVIKLDKNPETESYCTVSTNGFVFEPLDVLWFPFNDVTYNAFIVYKRLNTTDYECLHLLDFHFKIHTIRAANNHGTSVVDWLQDVIWFDNAKTSTPVSTPSIQNPSSYTLIDYYKFLVERGYNPYLRFNNINDYRLMVRDDPIKHKLLKYRFGKHDINSFSEEFDINESMQAWLLQDRTEWTAWQEKYAYPSAGNSNEGDLNIGSHIDNAGNLQPPTYRIAAGDGLWNYVKATNDTAAHYDAGRRLTTFDSELYKRGALFFLDPNLCMDRAMFNGNYIVNINSSQGSMPQLDTADNQDKYWHSTRHTVRRTDYDNVKDLSRKQYDFSFNKYKLELSLKNYLRRTSEPIHLGDRLMFRYDDNDYVLPVNNLVLDFNNVDKCIVSVG